MRTFVVAAVVAAVAAPPAEGHPAYHYLGGCEMTATSADTDDGRMQWSADVSVAAVATDAATGAPAPVPISVECELVVDGATPGTVVFSVAGQGLVAATGPVSYQAGPYDVVTVCEHVTVGGAYHRECGFATVVPAVAPPLWEAVRIIEHAMHPEPCRTLAALSGGPADQPPVFDVRTDGDVYVGDDLVWNCPPFDSSGD